MTDLTTHAPVGAPVGDDLATAVVRDEAQNSRILGGITRVINVLDSNPADSPTYHTALAKNAAKSPILRIAQNTHAKLHTSVIRFARGDDAVSIKDGLYSRYVGYAGTEKVMSRMIGVLSDLVGLVPSLFHFCSLNTNSRDEILADITRTYNEVKNFMGGDAAGTLGGGIAVVLKSLVTIVSSITALGETALNIVLLLISKSVSLIIGGVVHLIALPIIHREEIKDVVVDVIQLVVALLAYPILRPVRAIKEMGPLWVSHDDELKADVYKELCFESNPNKYLHSVFGKDGNSIARIQDKKNETLNAKVLGEHVTTSLAQDFQDTFQFFGQGGVKSSALRFIEEATPQALANIIVRYEPKGVADDRQKHKAQILHLVRLLSIKMLDSRDLSDATAKNFRVIIRALSQSDEKLVEMFDQHLTVNALGQMVPGSIIGRAIQNSMGMFTTALNAYNLEKTTAENLELERIAAEDAQEVAAARALAAAADALKAEATALSAEMDVDPEEADATSIDMNSPAGVDAFEVEDDATIAQ